MMIAQPSEFAWSSHAAIAHGHEDSTLRPHPAYQSLGSCAAERQSAYRTVFNQILGNDDNDIGALASLRPTPAAHRPFTHRPAYGLGLAGAVPWDGGARIAGRACLAREAWRVSGIFRVS
jgi:hypothetical protein